MKSQELSIIIYSCWRNRDMWEIFSILFRKYWSDCPYPILLVTDEYQQTDKQYVFTQVIQKDDTWAKMIKEAIRQAKTPYVSLWMDDYLLCDTVQNSDIEKQLKRAIKANAANIRLIESPKCHGHWKNQRNIGYYKRGEAYSLNTQIGIWDSAYLLRTLKDEWSAWDFERIASLEKKVEDKKAKDKKADKAAENQPILVSLDYIFPYEEGVRKGKWMQQGAKLCKRNGIAMDTNIRPIMTNMEMAKIFFQGAVLDWNADLVVKVQNMLAHGKCVKKN